MDSWASLPVQTLDTRGELAAQFVCRGLRDYQAAARYVGLIPYGRNSAADFTLVLHERRGTCSTKHALLAALAVEQQLPVSLMLGVYEMNESNTPGIGTVLEQHQLGCIPEAHCFLRYQGQRIDLTRSWVSAAAPIDHFLHEQAIGPEQIGAYKTELHRRLLREWAMTALPDTPWQQLWEIRERCIEALADPVERIAGSEECRALQEVAPDVE